MGSDGFQNLHKWKNSETIIANYPIIVYERPNFEIEANQQNSSVQIMKAPLLEISATHIRELVIKGKSIKYLVPEIVEKEILASGFFRKHQSK
jgi:nicotinate-nucleotide adenylyltransferase